LASLEFPGEVRFELDAPGAPQAGDWGNYARGAAQALARGGYALKRGLVGVITGPWSEGGLGSSAAVGVAYLLALEEANGLSVAAEENIILDQGIENGYLGLRNGILDQSGIVLSRVKHLTYIDCLTAAHELVPAGPGMPPWSVVLAFSGLKQALVGTDYNRRVAECQAAARILLEAAGRPEEAALLGRVRAGEYEGHKHQLPEPLRRRAAHFFSEVERVHQGVEAWRQGDLREFGRLMSASGDSSIGNYECGCPPLIELYQIMVRCPGVYGARFSGAGFRGCCLGLVESARAAAAAETIQRAYRERRPDLAAGAAVVVCHSGDGARFTGAPGGGGANAGKR
jgi:galacturonokinase